MDADLVGFSFSVAAGSGPPTSRSAHRYTGAPDQISLTGCARALKPLLEDAAPRQDRPESEVRHERAGSLRRADGRCRIRHHARILRDQQRQRSAQHGRSGEASISDRDTIHFEDVAGKGAKQITFDQVELAAATEYAAEDADVTLQLHEKLWPMLQEAPRLASRLYGHRAATAVGAVRVERTGTLIDGGLLGEQSRELAEKMRRTHRDCLRPWPVVTSTWIRRSSCRKSSMNDSGLPVLKKTPKGQPSTAEPVLQDLAREYELPQVIMDYRSMAKLKSTYTDKLPLQINQKTGRVHTSYHQAVAATGRLSSSDPNLQNIPIRTAEGSAHPAGVCRTRRGGALLLPTIPRSSCGSWRICPGMRVCDRRLRSNLDIHRATAAEVFGESLDSVTTDQRRNAKAINFGLIYGMSAFGLGRNLGISRTLAQDYIDRYFARYPGVAAYMAETRALAHDQGFVETVFGRRLYLPDINTRHAQRRQAAERTAINAPMQGTAADIIKRAMISVDAWLPGSGLDALMIMQVHDELVFEVAEDAVDDLVAGVTGRMAAAAELAVALVVDVGVGENWDQAH